MSLALRKWFPQPPCWPIRASTGKRHWRNSEKGNKSHLSPRMAQSTASHKRRCYFTPQSLSSKWCHGPQHNPANQSCSFHQQPPPTPHYALEHRAKHPCSLLKSQRSGFQHAGCNKHEAFSNDDETCWQVWHHRKLWGFLSGTQADKMMPLLFLTFSRCLSLIKNIKGLAFRYKC